MKGLFLFCLALSSLFIYGCEKPVEKLTVEQMQEDIEAYFDTLKISNPSLYQYYSIQQIDSLKDILKKEATYPMTVADFRYLLSKGNKYMNIHTGIRLNLWEKPLTDSIGFPGITIVDNEIYLGKYKLLEVNGKPYFEIISDLDNFTSWEYSPSGRISNMQKIFPLLLQNDYGFSSPYHCKLYDPNKDIIKDSVIAAVSENEIRRVINPSYSRYHQSIVDSLFYKDDGIAILYYNACDAYTDEMKLYWDTFTSSFFEKVKDYNIKYLFIDVSQNGGGTPRSHEYILKYLKSTPFSNRHKHYFTLQKAKDFYNDNLKRIAASQNLSTEEEIKKLEENKMFSSFRKRIANKEYYIDQQYGRKGNSKGFDGQVFLVMGNTFSSAYDFSEIIKRGQIGALAGEQAGQRMPYGGTSESRFLPHSGIRFRLSFTYFTVEPELTDSNGFLQPDIPYTLDHPLTLDDYKEIIRLNNDRN